MKNDAKMLEIAKYLKENNISVEQLKVIMNIEGVNNVLRKPRNSLRPVTVTDSDGTVIQGFFHGFKLDSSDVVVAYEDLDGLFRTCSINSNSKMVFNDIPKSQDL